MITLLPKPSNNGLFPLDLPLPTLDIFREGEQGSPGTAGWLAATRIWFECREDRLPNPILGVAEVVRLTGMKQSRVKRLLPQMAKWGVAYKEGTKYRFSRIGHLSDRSVFTDYKMAAHNERLAANRKQKDDGPEVPQLWEMDSSGVNRIRQPLGYFESGRASGRKTNIGSAIRVPGNEKGF